MKLHTVGRHLLAEGGTVLDPFAGSGTIFLACEGLDVEVNAIERDPEYCTLAIARGSSCK